MKYPLIHLTHLTESILQCRLYLDLRETSPMKVLDYVKIPLPKTRLVIPEAVDLV